jgi:metal-sulfur cluster biosynthetic enzyme
MQSMNHPDTEILFQQTRTALCELIDPEVGMNVIELGMLHRVDLDSGKLTVELIPTTPGCPMLDSLEQGALHLLQAAFPHHECSVCWRLDLEWSPGRMT